MTRRRKLTALFIAILLCITAAGCSTKTSDQTASDQTQNPPEQSQDEKDPAAEEQPQQEDPAPQTPAEDEKPKAYPTPEEVGTHTIPQELVDKPSSLPIPTAGNLPSSWKGFNLNDKQSVDRSWSNKPYDEWQVKAVHDFGFNFLRIAIDYRTWLIDGDCNKVNVDFLENELDQLIEWGLQYDVHIHLDMHIAPGHETSQSAPKDMRVLWEDETAQKDFARMWAMLARRYKGIPNQKLTFNLLNEPHDVSDESYAKVMRTAIDAIKEEDPDRLMVVDGNSYTTVPIKSLAGIPNVAQALHMYEPFGLTHYKASWAQGSDTWPVPTWPVLSIPSTIKGTYHGDAGGPMIINGDFGASEVTLRVGTVSGTNDLVVLADGKEVYRKHFVNTDGEGEWKEVHYLEEWDVYQNFYDKDYSFKIPNGTKKLELESTTDWLTVTDITIKPEDNSQKVIKITPTSSGWDVKQVSLQVGKDGTITVDGSSGIQDKDWIRETRLKPWLQFRDESNVGIFLGEWGVYQYTPHDVTLRYMKDMLDLFQEEGIGWALWNMDGSFGIINSGRSDVEYEDYEGQKLDREMLELLQQYID